MIDPNNAGIAAIQAKTGNLSADTEADLTELKSNVDLSIALSA